jgi:Excreted virulence factor EspC, type VII ESX diderm
MGPQNLHVQIEGLRSFAETHAGVASEMAGLLDVGAHAADVASTHGSIASAVHEALGDALDARQGVHRSVSDAASKLSASLKKAAHHYEQVDQHSAAAARKGEHAIGAAGSPTAGASPGPAAGTPASPAAGTPSVSAGGGAASGPAAGTPSNPATGAPISAASAGGAAAGGGTAQSLGQVGSQLAQSMSGLFEGKGQGGGSLGQLPQQLVQGAEQLAEQLAQGHSDKAGDVSEVADHAQPHGDAAGNAPTDDSPRPGDATRPQ